MEDLKKGDDIKISTISQIAELNEDQFDQFIIDLKAWHNFRLAAKQVNELAKSAGLDQDAVQMPTDYIHWVWDDSNNAEINIDAVDEEGATRFKDKFNIKYGEATDDND